MDRLAHQLMNDIVKDIMDSINNNTNRIRRLKCNRCEYEWNFKGKDRYRADCPSCHTTIVLNPVRKKKKNKAYL